MDITTNIIDNSDFIKLWKKEMISTLKQIHPDWKKKEIDDVLDEMLIEQMRVPKVTMDNNYTGEQRDTTMLSVFDWALRRKPLVAGNGTFYKNQHEAMNPIAKMLNGFLKKRKELKREMFKVKDKTSDLYKDLDRA